MGKFVTREAYGPNLNIVIYLFINQQIFIQGSLCGKIWEYKVEGRVPAMWFLVYQKGLQQTKTVVQRDVLKASQGALGVGQSKCLGCLSWRT